MRDVDLRDDLPWSFLLFSGYLKTAGDPVYRNSYPLAIPNQEVKLAYEEMVIRWFSKKIETNCLLDMLKALTDADMDLFERLLMSAGPVVASGQVSESQFEPARKVRNSMIRSRSS